MKPENATVTAECLEMLGQELKPLKQAEADGGLLPQVAAHPFSAASSMLLHRCKA